MRIETRRYEDTDGIKFDFAFSDKVYMNATEQYQVFGKSQQAFNSYKDSVLIPYAEKLIELGKVPKQVSVVMADNQQLTLDEMIVVRKGGNNPLLRGTWIHPKLQIVYGRWLKDTFAIWCDEMITELLTNGVVTLQPEDQKWVDFVESLCDKKPGNSSFMSSVYEALLIHEQEGYNIRAFNDLTDTIRSVTPKEDQAKVFKKVRELIKQMYEDGELSRTSHEQMLELCTVTVVEVLEKQVRSLKSKVRLKKITLTQPPTAPEVTEPTIADLTKAQQKENHDLQRTHVNVYNAEFLYGHKILGLDSATNDTPIKTYMFGGVNPVCDCVAAIQDAGLKVVFSSVLNSRPYDAKEGTPDLKRTDPSTNIGVSLWFNDDGSATCKIQKTLKGDLNQNVYKQIANLKLYSLTDTDPAFWTGTNPENTLRVTLYTITNVVMVYGYSSDKK